MRLRRTLLPLAIFVSPAAIAVTNGDLGKTSTGITEVSITVPQLVQLTVQDNVPVDYTTTGEASGSTGLCIYSKETSSVNVTLSTPEDALVLTNGSESIPYAVAVGPAASPTSIEYGTPVSVDGAVSDSASCSSTFPHLLEVTVSRAALDAAPAGAYSSTLTIAIEAI